MWRGLQSLFPRAQNTTKIPNAALFPSSELRPVHALYHCPDLQAIRCNASASHTFLFKLPRLPLLRPPISLRPLLRDRRLSSSSSPFRLIHLSPNCRPNLLTRLPTAPCLVIMILLTALTLLHTVVVLTSYVGHPGRAVSRVVFVCAITNYARRTKMYIPATLVVGLGGTKRTSVLAGV